MQPKPVIDPSNGGSCRSHFLWKSVSLLFLIIIANYAACVNSQAASAESEESPLEIASFGGLGSTPEPFVDETHLVNDVSSTISPVSVIDVLLPSYPPASEKDETPVDNSEERKEDDQEKVGQVKRRAIRSLMQVSNLSSMA